jgi:hypothetical protein
MAYRRFKLPENEFGSATFACYTSTRNRPNRSRISNCSRADRRK